MDGVLVDYTSSWTWVHDHFDIDNEETLLSYIQGRINDMEFMRQDIKKWLDVKKDICRNDLETILEPVPIIDGISSTVDALQSSGAKVVIVSGGLDITAKQIANEHGFDDYIANSVECDPSGVLTGEGILRVDLTNKGAALRRFQQLYGIDEMSTVSIGNSFVDVSMFALSGLSIAFNPIDEHVKKNANIIINSKDIRDILPHILE